MQPATLHQTRFLARSRWSILRALLLSTACYAALAPRANLAQPPAAEAPDSLDIDYASQLPRIPPTPPEKALATFEVQSGFRLEQVAAEPLVSDPIAMAFDENGRLFVIEMRDYSEQAEESLGVVRLLTDRDGDGRYDESTVFAEGLSWPTAVACWKGGVLIGAAPHIYYCRDTDGDGRSDSREIVFSGFHRTNVQGLLNSFRWRLDNRLVGATSSSGAEVRSLRHRDSEAISLRRRDFSIEPHTMTLAPASGGGQHGQSFDAFGRRYVCANSNHIQQVMYDDRYLARNPYVKAPAANLDIAEDGPQAPVFRSSPVEPWRIVRTRLRVKGLVPGPVEGGGKAAGYFTGATGITIYQGDAFPAEYQGNAFVADCGSNLIHRKLLQHRGLAATARRAEEGREFVASRDIWFRPVQMANAPDGALYVCDMSREVIEHPHSLPPLIKQHLDLTSGRSRGRIYRIVPEGYRQRPAVALGTLPTAELAPLLAHANGWHRETAARLIYERQDASIASQLEELAATAERAEGRIRALYALAGLDRLSDEPLLSGLDDQHPRVRQHAVRLAEGLASDSPRVRNRLYALAGDDDIEVRYQLAFSLGEFRRPGRVEALAAIARRDIDNAWMRMAVQSSLAHEAGAAFVLLSANQPFCSRKPGEAFLLELARQIAAQGRQVDLAMLLAELPRIQEASPGLGQRLIETLSAAADDKAAIARQLADATGGKSVGLMEQLVAEAKKNADDESLDADARVEAIGSLRLGSWQEVKPVLARLIGPRQPHRVQWAALATLGRFESPEVATVIMAHFDQFSPELRGEALEVLFARRPWLEMLLRAIEEHDFATANLDSARRGFLLNHPEEELRRRASKALGAATASSRGDVLRQYQAALELRGDAERGRMAFRRVCAACHRLEAHGHELGKDLKSIGERGPATILTNILDPNREVDPAYLNYSVVTDNGRVYSGVIVAETAASITLQRANGAGDTLLRREIDQLRNTGVSIMPEGLEKEIDVQTMADLIAYLMARD